MPASRQKAPQTRDQSQHHSTGPERHRLEVSDVPTGLHEPFLFGNTLYLAGYNAGARVGFYRYLPDLNRPGITYGSDPYNGMWIIQYFDSTLADTLKHIAFQDRISIGTIDPSNELSFHLAEGGAVIADSAVVEFVDNTHFRWDSWYRASGHDTESGAPFTIDGKFIGVR